MCVVCAGGGAVGVKVRKKRRQQRQTKEKVKKRGWGLAWSGVFLFFSLNLILLWKTYLFFLFTTGHFELFTRSYWTWSSLLVEVGFS